MPSRAFTHWKGARLPELDQIEAHHRHVGGGGRGRRWVTQQLNDAYVLLLAAHFQGFCRDLHSEACDHVARSVRPATAQAVVKASLTHKRRLDLGNAQPESLKEDFGRFGIDLWNDLQAQNKRNDSRRRQLGDPDGLNAWRNAIIHQDFQKVGGKRPTLKAARKWRNACEQLAQQFDDRVRRAVQGSVGSSPW